MTQDPKIERLLQALGAPGALDYPRFLAAIYETGYTGPYTVHCRNGVAKQVDIGAPIRLSIVEADPGGLDSEKPPGAR